MTVDTDIRTKAGHVVAIDFLQWLRPDGPWMLTAIIPDGLTITETFDNEDDALAFIAKHDGRRNLYYSLNPARRPMSSKASKKDIAAIEFLHVDIDPRDDERPEQAKARMMQRLAQFDPPPSAIIDSGNGLQLLWRLRKPYPLTGPSGLARFEGRNKGLARALGASPGTHNIDRILRLPGTMNLPNEKKLRLGRVMRRAKLLEQRKAKYEWDQFAIVEDGASAPKQSAAVSSDVPRMLQSLLHLSSPGAYETRSELMFAFICAAVNKGIADPTILKACLDTKFDGAIRAHCSEKGGEPYVSRQIARAHMKVAASSDSDKRPTQASVLVGLADGAQLFHDDEEKGYATIEIHDHRETWPIRSRPFKSWLTRKFYEFTKQAPNAEARSSALELIEAKARFDGDQRAVFLRVGNKGRRYYLDLCNEAWQAVEIDTEGWRIVRDPPVRFIRRPGMLPLPTPVQGGRIDALRPYLNVRDDNDFVLIVSWLLAALRDRGPYPVAVVTGEAGASKSTLLKLVRSLIDPNTAALRAPPRDDRDLFIAASNSYVPTFDNLSYLPDWLSDTLSRLATEGGFATRRLFTDDDEQLFSAMRPILIGSIENIVVRGDLADRSLFLTLPPIPDARRRRERELWKAFDRDRPAILGALLDAMVDGLGQLPHVRLDLLPRMADFAEWATACEGALWSPGTFQKAYRNNRAIATADVIEADPVAMTVQVLMMDQEKWTGEAQELLDALNGLITEQQQADKAWPKRPNILSNKLRRAAGVLRKSGIKIAEDHAQRTRRRVFTITRRPDKA